MSNQCRDQYLYSLYIPGMFGEYTIEKWD
jgi:hypothetical protein